MEHTTRNTMQAIAIDRFGGPETLVPRTIPVPTIGPDEVLLRVEVAGVGEWDPFEREGGYARMLGLTPQFPYVLGSEGAGTVVAVGERVRRFREGDRVYALGFLNPKGGFYAELAAVRADLVSFLPGKLTVEQAAVMGGVGITALRGLDDTLGLKQGESVMIFGASGGVGHMAVQLAKRMGARVLAVASGNDGVALAERLGADAALDGRSDDVLAAARAFAPEGLDAALLTASGEAAEAALGAVRDGGHVAYPNGVHPEPRARSTVRLSSYNGEPGPEIIDKLNRLIESGPFEVHVARTFPLAQAAEAHLALARHHLGKLALRVAE
ncbi:zinc-binding dehydrogenase [Sorangium cellulosum]|uniref:Zinc-binding dehydrogenase n=2 Tax=Sorangium cellulosum TaxID=56 RepID=A0A2L0F8X4_SORCE|nr:zinc-binding dehydrogenase [Sorangium cellulosum]